VVRSKTVATEDLYALKLKAIWRQFWSEHFSFWMICGYLFVEYVRPQSIIPALDFLPWAQVFILFSMVSMFADKKRHWASDPANKWMVLFFIVILLSCFNAYEPSTSYANLNRFYTWFVIYFLIINIVYTKERFFIFLAIFSIASFKISFSLALTWAKRGFSFASWGLMGPPGFFQNSGELAIQMCVFFAISYRVMESLRSHVSKPKFFILALMPITSAMVVMGASSRGGQIALVFQLFVMFWRQIFRPKIFLGIVLAGALIFVLIPPEQKARFSAAGQDRTSEQRLLYWAHGMEMIKEHPVLGVGYFNFIPYYYTHYSKDMLYPYVELPHNIFIQVGTDAGLTGLFVFLMLIGRTFSVNRATKKLASRDQQLQFYDNCARGLNMAMIGFLVAGQFVTVTYYPFIWINLSFAVALKRVVELQVEETS
jgi:O-antigen ligase